MSGVLKTVVKVAAVVGAIALAIPSGGTSVSLLAATLGVSGIAAAGIVAGLGIASSLLSRPKAPATTPAAADRLTASIETKAFRKFALGKTAMQVEVRS